MVAAFRRRLRRSWKFLVAIIAPLVLLPVAFIELSEDHDLTPGDGGYFAAVEDSAGGHGPTEADILEKQSRRFKLAYVILLMAVYWALEIIPLPITALFPLVMFPLFGIDDAANVSKSYMKESNTIFLGGAIVALAVEYCNLHRRVALRLITIIGVSPKRLMFGIMVVVSFLSMWISNTTTVTMIVPIIVAIVDEIHEVSDAAIADYTFTHYSPNDGENPPLPPTLSATIYSPSIRRSSVFHNRGMSSHHHDHDDSDAPIGGSNNRSTLGTLEGHRYRDTQHTNNDLHITVEENNNNNHNLGNFHNRPLKHVQLEVVKEEDGPDSLDSTLSGGAGGGDATRHRHTLSRGNSVLSDVVEPGRIEMMMDLPTPTPSECDDDIKRRQTVEREKWRTIKNMYLFALAYAANIGGTATITGTGPNKVFKEAIKPYADLISQDGKYVGMTFFTWLAFNMPPMLINVIVAWLYLVIKYCGLPKLSKKPLDENEHALKRWKEQNVRHYLSEEYKKLGKMSFHEIGVAIVFLLVVVLWILRDPQIFKGWKYLISGAETGDSTVALLGAVLLFIIPRSWSFLSSKEGANLEALLDWKFVTQKLPWGVLILLGSGYAIGDSAERTGLSTYIGKELYVLHKLPEPLLLFIVMFITTFITEVVSNTAVASILLPVLLGISREMGTHPLYLSVGVSVTASYAFMLPVASPVNAIVFAAGDFSIWEMIGNGYILNVICVLIFYVNTLTLGQHMFNYSGFEYPPLPSVNTTTTEAFYTTTTTEF